MIGLRTNTCIDLTVRYAAELGYDVTLVIDAIAAFSQAEIDATVQLNSRPTHASAHRPRSSCEHSALGRSARERTVDLAAR